jgi:hypothetical protein
MLVCLFVCLLFGCCRFAAALPCMELEWFVIEVVAFGCG